MFVGAVRRQASGAAGLRARQQQLVGRILPLGGALPAPSRLAWSPVRRFAYFGKVPSAELPGHWQHRISLWEQLSTQFPVTPAVPEGQEPDGEQALPRTAAEVLGQALEFHFRQKQVRLLSAGQTPDGRFYCDFSVVDPASGAPVSVTAGELPEIEAVAKKILKAKFRFDQVRVPAQQALPFFEDNNEFRTSVLGQLEQDRAQATLFRCGPMIDLAQPLQEFPDAAEAAQAIREQGQEQSAVYFANTGKLAVLSLLSCSGLEQAAVAGSHKLAVQRVYSVAFESAAAHEAWVKLRDERLRRDHRVIGQKLKLFMTHEVSPGGTFWLPHGTRVYNKIQEKLRGEYRQRGYDEVRTPLLYHRKLWEQSGHWDNYQDNMFRVVGGKSAQGLAEATEDGAPDAHNLLGLKPMNCPGHCLMFAAERRSYRNLPLRMADFSALHRDEDSGALSGLTRVTRFHQDDAHIFCRPDQIQEEILGCLRFIRDIYASCGLNDWTIALSTRPEKFVGEVEQWDAAEAALKTALERFTAEDPGRSAWSIKEGDGAFYGPKLDIQVQDALQRSHQCGTVQLDFQLPRRFNLRYQESAAAESNESGENPYVVMVHRAILGSVERFIAVLLEHHAGRLPLWLSPRQVLVLPIRGGSQTQLDYSRGVVERLRAAGFYADLQEEGTLNKRLLQGTQLAYNYMVIIGDKEVEDSVVEVRPLRLGDSQRRQQAGDAAAAEASSPAPATTTAALSEGSRSLDTFIRELQAEVDAAHAR